MVNGFAGTIRVFCHLSIRGISRVPVCTAVLLYSFGVSPGHSWAQGVDAFSVRDSAGITIMESMDSVWTARTAWIVEESPEVEIGSRFGESGAVFGSITDAARFSDGRFAVADPMSRTVGVFNRYGGFLFSVGGRGEGPMEIHTMGEVSVLDGDSLVVQDLRTPKRIYFGPSGDHLRTVTQPGIGWRGHLVPRIVGTMPDGSFLATYRPEEADYPSGRASTFSELFLFDQNGVDQGLIAALPAFATVNEGPTKDILALGPYPSFAPDQRGFWFGFPLTYELLHYSPQGVDRIVRRSWEPGVVPKRTREEYRAWRKAAFKGPVPDFVDRILRNEPIAETFPAFKQFLLSPDGHLWVEEYPTEVDDLVGIWERRYSASRSRWTVFDPQGRWLGSVLMPKGLRITEIGSDYVLGIWKDELDVSFVHLHRIVKPEAR